MDTNSTFIYWHEIIPEMRQEIRSRMPRVTQFMLASTCKDERTLTDQGALMATRQRPLLWQMCQTIIENMESLFEWLMEHFTKCVSKSQYELNMWTPKVGAAIGKSGNLKWWADDRLCAKLPNMVYLSKYNQTLTKGSDPLLVTRSTYLKFILKGLAAANHHDVFFQFSQRPGLNAFFEVNTLHYFNPDYSPTSQISSTSYRFLEAAALYGRLEWIIEMIARDSLYVANIADIIVDSAITKGHLHVLRWYYSVFPGWFHRPHGFFDLYTVILQARILEAQTIELIGWLYTVVRRPLPVGFLRDIIVRYLFPLHGENRWRLLEFARSTYHPLNGTRNINLAVKLQCDYVLAYLPGSSWEQMGLPSDATTLHILDWFDLKIEQGKSLEKW